MLSWLLRAAILSEPRSLSQHRMYNDALTELWDVPAMKAVVGGLPEGPDTADFSIFRSVAAIISKEEV